MVCLIYVTGFCERFVLLVDQGSEERFAGSCDLTDAADRTERRLFLLTCLSTC